jgi:microcystin-dependent protein
MQLFAAALCSLAISSAAQEPFMGEIRMVAFNYAPPGWFLCQGQTLSISSYSALYSILGTTYGGDGKSTFCLPDLQGRIPIGVGNGPGLSSRAEGEKTGVQTVAISVNQLPAHSHTISVPAADSTIASTDQPRGAFFARNAAAIPSYGLTANSVSGGGTSTGSTGSGQSMPIMPPFLCVYFIIANTGDYPSHN